MIEARSRRGPHGDGDWFAGYMAAFRNWVKSLGAPVYSAEEAAAVRASMSLTSANGGYALPFLLDPTLIHTGTATKTRSARSRGSESGTSDKWNSVTVSNVTTAWTAEVSPSPTAAHHRRGDRGRGKLTAYVTGSFEIFQDSNLLAGCPA